MDITLTPTADLTADLTVRVTPTDYQAALEKRLKEFSQKAQIKGFRPGKVPPALIRKMYGKSLLVEEVNKALSEGLNTYIREQKLRLLGEPLPAAQQEAVDFDTQQEFTFKFEIGQLPDVQLPAGGALTVARYQITVDDATLEETMDQIRRQFGQSTQPETAEMGDYLTGTLRQVEGEFSTRTMLPLVKLTGEQDKFVGAKVDQTIRFDLQAAFGGDAKAIAILAGVSKDEAAKLTGEFEFVVSQITRTEAPEMNQELFDKVFGAGTVSSEEEFRQKVRETVQQNYDREADKLFNHQVVDTIVQNTPIQLPEDFFKKWLVAANEGKLTAEQVEQNIGQYSNELRWSMIRNYVMESQDVKISQQDVRERATQQLLEQFGMGSADEETREQVAKFADQQLRQDNGRGYRDTFEAIVADRAVEYLRGLVLVEDRPVTAEEFRTMSV